MSMSPRKRSGGGGVPEVVIYTKPKSPSKRAAALAREKAAQEEAEFAGLSRIEQIRLRARRKAEQEDRDRQEVESRPKSRQRTAGLDDEDDEDDEDDVDDLPELDLKRLTRRATTTSIKSSPNQPYSKTYGSEFEGPLSSLTTSTDDISSSLSLPQSQNGPSAATPVQRSRRTTARVEPYIFRPSLDPISERRQKLMEAKESAAVQARLIKKEDFKKSAHDGKSDAIEKVLRDHRRDQRRGLDVDGLHATIKMGEDVKGMLDTLDEEDDQVMSGSGDASDDDTSVASSSRSESPLPTPTGNQGIFPQSTEEEKDRQKRSLLDWTGEGDDSDDGNAMFDILAKDKELANRRRQVGQGIDAGLEERVLWRRERIPMSAVVFPDIDGESTLYAMLRETSESGQDIQLTVLLTSVAFVNQVESEEDSHIVSELAAWLFETAVLKPTSQVSFAALQALHTVTTKDSAHRTQAALAIFKRLPLVLSRLGAKDEILDKCFDRQDSLKCEANEEASRHVRKGERVRAVERLLLAIDSIFRASEAEVLPESREERLQLFSLFLRLGIDPQLSEQKNKVERLLETFLAALLKDDAEMDDRLLLRLKTLLLGFQASTTRLAVLDILPSATLRSRPLQRRLAYELLVDLASSTVSTSHSDYTLLANILSDKSAATNPFLVTAERDYMQVDANVQLLCYAFTDFALQILVSANISEESERKPARKGLSKVIQNYQDYDEDSAAFVRQLYSSSTKKTSEGEGHSWEVNTNQVKGVHQIMEALQALSSQIHDGKGAFMDRSIVKDQMQRLRLMLQYQLAEFGLAPGSDLNQQPPPQQGKLSRWFK